MMHMARLPEREPNSAKRVPDVLPVKADACQPAIRQMTRYVFLAFLLFVISQAGLVEQAAADGGRS
jgi:hypothetical protein